MSSVTYKTHADLGRHRQAVCGLKSVLWLVFVTVWLGSGVQLWGAYRSDPDYLIDTWETQQGLPDNSATAIVQAPDGYLWIGTFNGLVQFNGVDFKVYDPASTSALPSAGIVNLHMDATGRLWVSTLKGLASLQGGRWISYAAEHGANELSSTVQVQG